MQVTEFDFYRDQISLFVVLNYPLRTVLFNFYFVTIHPLGLHEIQTVFIIHVVINEFYVFHKKKHL